LLANGRVEEAYETIRLAMSHHPSDVSLLLVSWNLSCRLGVAPLHTLQDIRLQNELRNYRDVVTIPLREFLSNYLTGVCEYPESEEIVAFFSRLDELECSSNSRSVFHLIYSDLFVLLGELDNALIQLSKAFDSYNNPELIVRQAILSASAGNYENALIFLGRASSAYGNWRDPGSAGMTQVDAMRREITAMLQQESQVQ
jgi:tetratricopeptide (TPR) repeat protein